MKWKCDWVSKWSRPNLITAWQNVGQFQCLMSVLDGFSGNNLFNLFFFSLLFFRISWQHEIHTRVGPNSKTGLSPPWCDYVIMASTSSSSLDSHGGHWFPSWFIWPLFFLTSALRVHYVTQPRNWWIMHPDEIYQTMEGIESYSGK